MRRNVRMRFCESLHPDLLDDLAGDLMEFIMRGANLTLERRRHQMMPLQPAVEPFAEITLIAGTCHRDVERAPAVQVIPEVLEPGGVSQQCRLDFESSCP